MTARARRAQRADDLQAVAGVIGLALTGSGVHESAVGPVEAALFRAVNRLPDRIYAPSWVVMQTGNAMAAPVTALLVWRSGRHRLAARVLSSGLLAWAAAKLVKRVYRRPRPAGLVGDVTFRGEPATGLGYVSGHAAVSTAVTLALRSELPPSRRALVALGVPIVALSRMYVGAHLPLDVLGGVALGMSVDGCVGHLLDVGGVPDPSGHWPLWSAKRRRDARGVR